VLVLVPELVQALDESLRTEMEPVLVAAEEVESEIDSLR